VFPAFAAALAAVVAGEEWVATGLGPGAVGWGPSPGDWGAGRRPENCGMGPRSPGSGPGGCGSGTGSRGLSPQRRGSHQVGWQQPAKARQASQSPKLRQRSRHGSAHGYWVVADPTTHGRGQPQQSAPEPHPIKPRPSCQSPPKAKNPLAPVGMEQRGWQWC